MRPLRFVVTRIPGVDLRAFDELCLALTARGAPKLEPLFVDNYVALYELLRARGAEVGWCPPFVARDLERGRDGAPIATVLRRGVDHYYSALVTLPESSVRHIGQVPGRRVGWVSRASAAGFIVPRCHLRSRGLPLTFAKETFFHTHARAASALLDDEVDVIATYAAHDDGGFELPSRLRAAAARIVAAAGPIPGDVIVCGQDVAPEAMLDLTTALLTLEATERGPVAALMGATGFGMLPRGHLESLSRWSERSEAATFRPVLPFSDLVTSIDATVPR